MDINFLNQIVASDDSEAKRRQDELYRLKVESQIRRVMQWYNVNRDDAIKIRDESLLPALILQCTTRYGKRKYFPYLFLNPVNKQENYYDF